MPRPVKDDPRDRFMSFRFTEAEVTRLKARARASGQTPSAFVRGRIFDHDPEAGPPPLPEASSPPGKPPPGRLNQLATRVLADQLRRIGVNLNQIAHRMNELRIPPPRDLTMLIDELRALVREARAP